MGTLSWKRHKHPRKRHGDHHFKNLLTARTTTSQSMAHPLNLDLGHQQAQHHENPRLYPYETL
jgi:hypothetical protein